MSYQDYNVIRPTPYGLVLLVDELLLNIIAQIDERVALINLAATCVRFQDLVEPFIWRKLLVVRGLHAHKITVAIDSRPERVDYVHELSVRYRDEVRDGIETLNYYINIMQKLRHFTIESPCPNNLEWRSGVFFDGWSRIDYATLLGASVFIKDRPLSTLPMLQSLTLHGHGSEGAKFSLSHAVAIFFHPTLRNITISCLNFAGNLKIEDMLEKNAMSTPLQSLTLIECNVNVEFLWTVLGLPKALKEISIGERLHIFSGCKPSMDPETRTSSTLFLDALQRQAHSLERVTHVGGLLSYQTPRATDLLGSSKMRSLTKLQYLELGFESNLYYYLRDNGFPPSLKTLKMVDTALTLTSGHDLRGLVDIIFRSLVSLSTSLLPSELTNNFTLHLAMADKAVLRSVVPRNPTGDLSAFFLCSVLIDRPSVYRIATAMRNHHAKFHISREVFKDDIFIPPYMYGEALPTDETLYDSVDFWRICGLNFQDTDEPRFRGELKTNENGGQVLLIQE